MLRAVNDNLAIPLRLVDGGKVWVWAAGLLYSYNAGAIYRGRLRLRLRLSND
jgi:hypothetical protein